MRNPGEMSPVMLKELKVRRDTSTPFWFGLKTILKVRHGRFCAHLDDMILL